MIKCGPYIGAKKDSNLSQTLLGRGGYGVVFLARHKETKELWALKMIPKTKHSAATEGMVRGEISLMQELSHQNIIKILDSDEDAELVFKTGDVGKAYYIALEYASNKDLFGYISKGGAFTEDLARFYFSQLLGAVEELHKQDIAHRDIKPENILFSEDFTLKLIDFGLADTSEVSKVNKGTLAYKAPEVFSHSEFKTKPVDVFALGVVLFILTVGVPPFMKATLQDQRYKIFVADKSLFWKITLRKRNERLSTSLTELLEQMLNPIPSERIWIEEILNSKWLNEPMMEGEDAREAMNKRKEAILKNKQ